MLQLKPVTFAAAIPPEKPASSIRRSTFHGQVIEDEFHDLRAANWQEVLKDGDTLPPEIRKRLVEENHHTDTVMRPAKNLQKTLLKELRARIKEEDSSPPSPDGPFAYFTEYRENGEYPLIRRQQRHGGTAETLLDCEQLAKRRRFFDLGDSAHSPNHELVAWSVDFEGSEFYEIRVRDPKTGKDLKDRIRMTDGSIVWASDSKALYYVRIDNNHRPRFVMRHVLGTPESKDVAIHTEKSDTYFIDISESQSGVFGIINISGHQNSEEWLFDLTSSQPTARLVAARDEFTLYDCDHHGERLFIRTNADGAEDFKIVTAPLSRPERGNWKDYVPHRKGVMILSTLLLKDYFLRLERENGIPRLVVHDLVTGEEHVVGFDEEAYDLSLASGYEFDTELVRFEYSSMATPDTIFEYNLRTRERSVLKRQEIPSGHDPQSYVTKRINAVAADGETIPISLLHRRDMVEGVPASCLLYAYGSYGYAMTSSFDSDVLSLVDRGYVYAIAHVRGGTDKGWHWYEDGKKSRKKNTFEDFIAVARHLCDLGYTAPKRIVAQGASAGGMLMGAIANMAPELFAGIVAEVPFVDVLNTILDAELPLTPPEWLEWGNPIEDATMFDYIKSYSPYDNVDIHDYPAILATGGLTDPRVTYWEPAKWVARIRARMTGGGPILLKTNLDAGHGGSSGRFEQLNDVALAYAFAITAVESARRANKAATIRR